MTKSLKKSDTIHLKLTDYSHIFLKLRTKRSKQSLNIENKENRMILYFYKPNSHCIIRHRDIHLLNYIWSFIKFL